MYSAISANKRKTVILMVVFFVLVGILASLFSLLYDSYTISIYALVFALGYGLWSYFASARLALALNGAKEIKKSDSPRLYRTVENLCIAEGLPMPKVYIIEDRALNAFASGRDPKHAVVCATSGLVDALTDTELEGVMAHELGHIKNYDIRVSMIAFALVAVVSLLCDFFFRISFWGGNDDNDSGSAGVVLMVIGIIAIILAPLVASLLQLAISRKREYLADATGAMTTRYPEGLASALEKIQAHGSVLRKQNASTAHLFFANPLRKASLARLFSTHPPIEDRIRILRGMETKV